MNDIVNARAGGDKTGVKPPVGIDDILDGYYIPGPERKHRSPTKRLINLKNSTTDHK